jgi:hypothetical protein
MTGPHCDGAAEGNRKRAYFSRFRDYFGIPIEA